MKSHDQRLTELRQREAELNRQLRAAFAAGEEQIAHEAMVLAANYRQLIAELREGSDAEKS